MRAGPAAWPSTHTPVRPCPGRGHRRKGSVSASGPPFPPQEAGTGRCSVPGTASPGRQVPRTRSPMARFYSEGKSHQHVGAGALPTRPSPPATPHPAAGHLLAPSARAPLGPPGALQLGVASPTPSLPPVWFYLLVLSPGELGFFLAALLSLCCVTSQAAIYQHSNPIPPWESPGPRPTPPAGGRTLPLRPRCLLAVTGHKVSTSSLSHITTLAKMQHKVCLLVP